VSAGANTFECEADIHGAWRLPVDGLELGTPVLINAGEDARVAQGTYTPAVAD